MISVLYFPLALGAFRAVVVAALVWGVFAIGGWYVAAHDRGYWRGWADRADDVRGKRR